MHDSTKSVVILLHNRSGGGEGNGTFGGTEEGLGFVAFCREK